MISKTSLEQFRQRIADLPDEPVLAADELKARFDACPEELRVQHNALVSGLLDSSAAGELGFARTSGVPADNVQEAVENVQEQLIEIAFGSIPEGSVGRSKLTGEINDELNRTQQTLQSLTQKDVDLQTQVRAKAEIVVGTYQGDDTENRKISLGFTPRAVFVTDSRGVMVEGNIHFGGFSTTTRSSAGVTISDGGITVYNNKAQQYYTNRSSYSPYNYMAVK